MARSPVATSIPMPTNDPDVLYQTCMALKQVVEGMQGTVGPTPSARIYVVAAPPEAQRDGEFWLSGGAPSTTLSVSLGGKWFTVATLA